MFKNIFLFLIMLQKYAEIFESANISHGIMICVICVTMNYENCVMNFDS